MKPWSPALTSRHSKKSLLTCFSHAAASHDLLQLPKQSSSVPGHCAHKRGAPTTQTSPCGPTASCRSARRSLTPVSLVELTRCTADGDGMPACLRRWRTHAWPVKHSHSTSEACSLRMPKDQTWTQLHPARIADMAAHKPCQIVLQCLAART